MKKLVRVIKVYSDFSVKIVEVEHKEELVEIDSSLDEKLLLWLNKEQRKVTCIPEILEECLGKDLCCVDKAYRNYVSKILRKSGWICGKSKRFGKRYGVQRAFYKSF